LASEKARLWPKKRLKKNVGKNASKEIGVPKCRGEVKRGDLEGTDAGNGQWD